MKPKFLAFPLVFAATSHVIAGDFAWRGTNNSTWTDSSNWEQVGTGDPPIAPLEPYPTPGNDYPIDRLLIGKTGAFGAIYNPGTGVTTIFRQSRGFVNGSGGAVGDLTVTSGTIAVINAGSSGQEPIMANGVSAELLVNGGAIDFTAVGSLPFILANTGASGLTSTLTINSGSFTCNGFNLFAGSGEGTSTINLEGTGLLAVTRFLHTHNAVGGGTSTINLDGGTLRTQSTVGSPNFFLPPLPGTQVIVKAGGAKIDTFGFNNAITAVLEHDPALGETADGGLTKSGVGTLNLTGDNTYTGGLTINGGTALTTTFSRVNLSHDNAAGTGVITLADSYAEVRLVATTGRIIDNPLVISDTGDEKSLIFTQAGTATCSGPITINESNVDHFRVRSDSSNLNLTGKISGVGGINRYAGGSVVELTNSNNDFTGGAKLSTGTLGFATGALGTTGTLTMDGGILRWAVGNTEDVSSRIVMVDGKNASFSTNGNDVTFASSIGNSSTAGLSKTGTAGTLTLNGSNSYTGITTIVGGTLLVNGSLDAASAVAVNGTSILGGTGIIGGSVTVAAGAKIAPGASAGLLTIGGGLDVALMADGPGTLNFELGSDTANSDRIAAGGTLTIGIGALGFSDFQFSNLGTLQPGIYTLITSGGINPGDSLDPNNLTGAIDANFNGELSINGNNIELTVTVGVSGFAAWQAANNTAGGLNEDHDGDGVSNGLEFFLGGTGDTTGFTTPLPGVINSDGTLSVTWVRHPDYPGFPGNYGTAIVVETSATLANPWTPALEGIGGDKVEISGNNVKYTFPVGSKNFARLRITGP